MGRRTTPVLTLTNAVLRPAARSRRDPDRAWARAVNAAQREAGVEADKSDQDWIEEFRFLLNCVAEVPSLTPIGWISSLNDAQQRLVTRLRVRRLHHTHPEIGAEPIERPIFVVGLPRTATTLAHRILAMAPGHRGPLRWEMACPDLPVDPDTERQRVKLAEKANVVTKWAPDFDIVHPVEATKAEESILLLPQGMYHVLYHSPMPRYQRWLAERDAAPDYQYLKEVLQVLQHGRDRRRWVLKNPLDLAQMATIKRVFPDATFVWTHRDPITVMGSLCSLIDLSYSLFLKHIDRAAIGRLALEVMTETVESGRSWRQNHRESIIDVPYHRLNADPDRYVPELYQKLGATWSAADAAHLADALARPVTDRRHEYTIRQFDLTEDQIEAAFGDYLKWVVTLNS
ncbi:sulfotransferase family protein [Glycomyces harbinensis]|uniref:Sulfotransferase family protein n=1 Tax=Glycomyces harbinensis TaxID=58114 RepID=A0A1G7ADD9_9ACTN|nr:sulfotransferase [Glycomyces harbinensis]SDE11886.1 Sulfotransferase family protein [Glycomyces harbinensis]